MKTLTTVCPMHNQVTVTPDIIAYSTINSHVKYHRPLLHQNREVMLYLPYRGDRCLQTKRPSESDADGRYTQGVCSHAEIAMAFMIHVQACYGTRKK